MTEAALEDDWPRTVAGFELWHARQPARWELIGGRRCPMATRSKAPTIIKGNLCAALPAALEAPPWLGFTDGGRILADELSAPPAVVSCAPVDRSTPVVAAPAIVGEIMSLERDPPSLAIALADLDLATALAG